MVKWFRDDFGDQFSSRGGHSQGFPYRGEDRADRDRERSRERLERERGQPGDRGSQYSWEPIPRYGTV